MNIAKIRAKAKQEGIKPGKMKKDELIREIQKHEGNVACFKRGIIDCAQMDCLWREDCIAS